MGHENSDPVDDEQTLADTPPMAIAMAAPTLDEAFHTLCMAMAPLCGDDLVRQRHCAEIRGWLMNGNTLVAWQHAVMLLEGLLGSRLTQG